jgi:hypothetical protein
MATRKPLVLISGVSSELPPGDLVPGVDTTAQASGNAALVVASNALASGNLGVTNSATAQASGNAALVVGTTALASGNAGISVGLTALASGNAGISTGLTALASGNAALSSAATAQASGNAALSSLANKYDKTGGPISGPAFTRSQTFGVPSGTILGSGVITLNFGLSDNFEVVLTAGTSTLASPVNASGGQCGALIFRQDSVGSRLLTYSGSWSFVAATAPTLTTTASGVDMLGYYVVNPSRINIVSNLNFGSGTVS